jgi:transcription termination factor Rho
MNKNNKNITIRNQAIINSYINQTKNKPNMLPTTEIIDYIKNNYNSFLKEKEQNLNAGKDEIELGNIFFIPPGLNSPEKIVNINEINSAKKCF